MGQHGVHLGPVGPRWAPCWPHELCYQGYCFHIPCVFLSFYRFHNMIALCLETYFVPWFGWLLITPNTVDFAMSNDIVYMIAGVGGKIQGSYIFAFHLFTIHIHTCICWRGNGFYNKTLKMVLFAIHIYMPHLHKQNRKLHISWKLITITIWQSTYYVIKHDFC